MEWITVTAPSVSEAKELLLDKLGVPDGDAEFVVEDEGESKFFGLRKTEARVKARVLPKGPEQRGDRKRNRKDRGPKKRNGNKSESGSKGDRQSSSGGSAKKKVVAAGAAAAGAGSSDASKDRPAKKARQRVQKEEISVDQVVTNMETFLNGLATAFGIDEKAEIEQDEENIIGHIRGQHGVLVGPKARTLDAIQEIAKIASFKGGTSPARLKVDVGGYRAKRAEALGAFARKAADKAITDETEVVLDPMTSADRKVVHDALSEISGIETRSVGTDPRRRVVIAPLAAGE